MEDVSPATEDPHTRAALEGYRAGALRWLAGGVIAVVLAVLLGAVAISLAEDRGRPVPLAGLVVVALVSGGVVSALAGLGGLARALRWSRALRAVSWQRGLLRIAGPAIIAFEPEGYDEWDPDDEPVRLRLVSTSVWRTRQVQDLDGGEVRAAPVGGGQWVLTAEGLPTLYGARTARRPG
jgi:energy-converting hydrogenase Eha subunit C